jgi:hypothetical protein
METGTWITWLADAYPHLMAESEHSDGFPVLGKDRLFEMEDFYAARRRERKRKFEETSAGDVPARLPRGGTRTMTTANGRDGDLDTLNAARTTCGRST